MPHSHVQPFDVRSNLASRYTLEGKLGAVEVLKRLPEHDECMRPVNWPADVYVHPIERR